MLTFYSLFSGSSGNCSYISDGNVHILIDAGVSCKRITQALASCSLSLSDISAVLITHEHTDHVAGVDVMCRRGGVNVLANEQTLAGMSLSCDAMKRAYTFEMDKPFEIGGITITPFHTPHDTPKSAGFVFEEQKTGKRLAYASDLGHISREVGQAMLGCDGIFIESNHDVDMLMNGDYPYMLKRRVANLRGHLSNEECAGFLKAACSEGTSRIILGHLSRENNYPRLAYETTQQALTSENIIVGRDVTLSVAPAAGRSEVISL